MKQKRIYKVIAWFVCVAMLFQAAGITTFASEITTEEEIVLTAEEMFLEEKDSSVEKTTEEEESTSVIEETTVAQESIGEETQKVLFAQTVQSDATSFEVDSLYYEILSETDKTVILTGVDRSAYSGYLFELPEIVVPSTVSYEGVTYSVTEIGEFAFADYTFDLEFGNPLQGYDQTVSTLWVNKITVSDGVKKIGGGAFYRMNQLKEIVLPDSVEEIGMAAFYLDTFRFQMDNNEDDTLLKVNIPQNVKHIGAYAYSGVTFEGTLVIPDGVETIGEYAFGWEDIFDTYSVVDVPASVTTIGKNAFHTSSLVKAVLRKTTMPTVIDYDDDNVYSAIMFGDQYLSNLLIHVPADLIDDYESSYFYYYLSQSQFVDIAEYVPGETTSTETFHLVYDGNPITELAIKVTQTAFVQVVIDNDEISLDDITWELVLTDGLQSASTNPADFLEFKDEKTGLLQLKAKKVGYLRLTGKVAGYENVTLDITNLYTTEEETLDWIERLASLTQEEIQLLSVVQASMGTQEQMAEIREKAQEIVKDCTTDRERIFAVEQWLATHVAYDCDYLPYCDEGVSPIKMTAYGAYEAFYNHFTVCGGYANLAEAMLRSIGIPCVQIFGLVGDAPDNKSTDHAWNAAYDADAGKWIYFDATWDSTSNLIGSYFQSGKTRTTWFDFDAEAECGNRYISSSSLDWEDYEAVNYVKSYYITLYVGETQKLNFLEGVEYTSLVAKGDYLEWEYDFDTPERVKREDTFITVDANGNVTGVKEGMGIVEVDGFYDIYVRVLEKKEQAFSKETYTVALGSSATVETLLADVPTTGLMEFTSDDTSVVTIDENGVLTPVAVGTATITGHLYCNDSYPISCKVVVVETIEEETVIEFEQDNLVYEVLTQPEEGTSGTVSVVGETFINYESNSDITVNIPETVVYEEKSYTVTRIGPKAFAELVGNATVSIPASVQCIEREAFYGPRSKVGAELTGELIFPENSQLEYIGDYAFADNPKLTKVDLSNCTKLETIGDYAFYSCSYSTVKADGTLKDIGITEVVLPDNLKVIGDYAFYLSQLLTTVNIPGNMDSIGEWAFADTNLTGIMDLSGVKEVGDDIFRGQDKLEGVIINDDWTEIPDKMFLNVQMEWVASESCLEEVGGVDGIENGSLLLSEAITHIGEEAFYNCYKLNKVQAPGVVSVEKKSFAYCVGVESFDFEQNLTVIPEKAFMYCSALTEFTLNPELTEIGYGAMYGLSKLTDIRIVSEKIRIFGDRCFSKGTNFYIPRSVSENYMKGLKSCAGIFYDLDGTLLETVIKNVEAYLIEYPIYKEGDPYDVIREDIRFYVEYNDNTFEDITNFEIETGTFTDGGQDITVTYGNYTDTIIVGISENQNPVCYLDVDFIDYVIPTFKVGESYQNIRDKMIVSVLDENMVGEIVENYDVEPGYFVEGANYVTISFCDFVGKQYHCTEWCLYGSNEIEEPDKPVNPEIPGEEEIVTGITVEIRPGGGLENPKAGHIVGTEDLIVYQLVETENGTKKIETSDYIIYDDYLHRGKNTITVNGYDRYGNVFSAERDIYAEAQLDALDVKLNDSVKLKPGDVVMPSQFTATASYIGENNYIEKLEVMDFVIEGNAVITEGENVILFSYTETTAAYGTITKTAEWKMYTDDKPVLPVSAITINQYATDPASFEVYMPLGLTPQLDGVFYQNIKGTVQSGIFYVVDEDGVCTIQIPEIMKNKSYKLYIKVLVEETQNVYYLPITLTLKASLPKITASAEAMNLFFTDEESRTSKITLKNPSAEVIRSVAFEDNSTMDQYFDIVFDQHSQTLALKLTDQDATKQGLVNKGKLLVWTENYNRPVTVSIKLSVSDKQPKLKVAPTSVNINTRLYDQKETSFEVTMLEGKAYVPVSISGTTPQLVTCAELINQVRAEDNKITLTLNNTSDFSKLKTVKMKIQAANWKNPVQVSYKVKTVNVLPKAVLGAKTLTLDMRAIGAEVSTTLQFDTKAGDVTYKDLPEVLTASKNDEQAPKVTLEKVDDRTYTVQAAYVDTMKNGSYKYDITPELSDGTKLKKVTLTIKVTTADKVAGASLKAQKGSKIELISRASTKYEYKVSPTVKGTYIKSAVLKKVEQGNVQVDASLFDVKVNVQEGVVSTIEVFAAEEGNLLSNKKYTLTFEVTPATDALELNPAEVSVTVTPKESTLKLSANVTSAVLYRNISRVSAVYKVTPQTVGAEIDKMEYVPSSSVPAGAFEITQTAIGTYQIRIADTTKVAANKSYKLSFRVQAKGGTKTVTQNVTINVK